MSHGKLALLIVVAVCVAVIVIALPSFVGAMSACAGVFGGAMIATSARSDE